MQISERRKFVIILTSRSHEPYRWFLGNKSLHCLKHAHAPSAKNSIAFVESKDISKMVDDIVKLYTESRFHSGSHIETTSIVELVPELIRRNVFDDDLNSTCINQ